VKGLHTYYNRYCFFGVSSPTSTCDIRIPARQITTVVGLSFGVEAMLCFWVVEVFFCGATIVPIDPTFHVNKLKTQYLYSSIYYVNINKPCSSSGSSDHLIIPVVTWAVSHGCLWPINDSSIIASRYRGKPSPSPRFRCSGFILNLGKLR
jgi:hypothetical protein